MGPLRILQFLPAAPHWILQPEVMRIYLLGTGTLGWVVWCGAGIPPSPGILTNFYPPHILWGPPILHLYIFVPLCSSLLLLPIWMNVTSLIPWLSDFHTAQFSDSE